MRKFWTVLRDVARGASHNIGTRNAIETFSTILGHTAKTSGHDIAPRYEIESFLPNSWEVARAAGHDITARSAIEFFSFVFRANNATSRARPISSRFVEQMFNRTSRAHSVTIGSRNASKFKNLQSHITCQFHAERHSHHLTIKHVSVATPIALMRLPTPCDWVHSRVGISLAGFHFYAIEFTRNAINSQFHLQLRLPCDVKLPRNRPTSNFHMQPTIVILVPICSHHTNVYNILTLKRSSGSPIVSTRFLGPQSYWTCGSAKTCMHAQQCVDRTSASFWLSGSKNWTRLSRMVFLLIRSSDTSYWALLQLSLTSLTSSQLGGVG